MESFEFDEIVWGREEDGFSWTVVLFFCLALMAAAGAGVMFGRTASAPE